MNVHRSALSGASTATPAPATTFMPKALYFRSALKSPNPALQPTANPLRGLSAAELGR